MTKATLTGAVESRWYIKKLSSKKWELSLWHRRDRKRFVRFEEGVEFEAKTEQEAKAKALEYQDHCEKIWRPQEETAFTNVPPGQQERWVNAWIQAHKSEWPTFFSLPPGEKNEDKIKQAMTVDLLAMGFTQTASLKIFELAKGAKAKMRPADQLNAWIVQNWFHGERLFALSQNQRAELAKRKGYSAKSAKSLGMKISRIGLTTISGRQ